MTSPDPTDRERFNYEILKYELETFQSRYKNFEKTYLLIIGISIFFIFFFSFPYSTLLSTKNILEPISSKLDEIGKDSLFVRNLINSIPSVNHNKILPYNNSNFFEVNLILNCYRVIFYYNLLMEWNLLNSLQTMNLFLFHLT